MVDDLDETATNCQGTAIAWSDSPEHLNSLVRIRTSSTATAQRLLQVPVTPLYANGNVVPPEAIEQLRTSGNVIVMDPLAIDDIETYIQNHEQFRQMNYLECLSYRFVSATL